MSRGIMLFNAPMVRAIRAGNKTQTRRIVKPQPETTRDMFPTTSETMRADGSSTNFVFKVERTPGIYRCLGATNFVEAFSPFGQPGELIAVRETFYAFGRWETRYSKKKGRDEWHFVDMTLECGKQYAYAADGDVPSPLAGKRNGGVTPAWWKRPAIHMPLVASRIMLEITAVRVERLNDISNADAIQEGVNVHADHHTKPRSSIYSPVSAYRDLWESINGAGSWDANPWVWVVEFKVMRGRAE